MLCSAISNSSPCQPENLALNIVLHKSLKYGLIYGREMVSVQGMFEQTKAIQAGGGEGRERKKRQNAKIVKNPQQNNKLTEEKSTKKGHYKQVFNRWTKSAMTYQFKMVHMLYSKKLCCCSYLSHHILRAIKNPNKRISVLLSKS